jgi:glycosyl transferase family 87
MKSEGRPSFKRGLRTQEFLIAAAVGLLALGVYLWQLSVPEFLSSYDSGVYFAASIHFVTGVLPYKDFTFVQPPGIVLILSPIALISRFIGTHDGFILARILTSLVTALNVSLLALLVRHRGRIAMVVAGVGLGLLPVAFYVSSAVKLEPYCLCLVLLGSLVILWDEVDDQQLASRSLVIGGTLFGLAALVKLWAVFPFLALVMCLALRCRRRVMYFVGSAAASFFILALPFFVAAPKNFTHQVFLEQLTRKTIPGSAVGILVRLIVMSGFANSTIAPSKVGAVLALIALLVVIAVAFHRRMDHELVDFYLLLAGLITACGLLAAPAFYLYYGYFTAPFLVGIVAISTSRLGEPARVWVNRVKLSRDVRTLVSWIGAIAGALVIVAFTLYTTTFYTNFVWFWGINSPNITPVNRLIPAGSCVVYSWAIYGVDSNRLLSNNSNCPSVVDANGMWMEWGYRSILPSSTFVAEWKGYFESAQYVVLNSPHTNAVPWNRNLTGWFNSHFHLIYGEHGVFIYVNDAKKETNHA